MLAAYGSGASRVSHDEDKRILNIDIGGGTTKLAVVEKGHVIATAAFHIGGRLQVVDEKGMIVRLDPAGRYHARQAGFDWHKGDVIDTKLLDKVADDDGGRARRGAHRSGRCRSDIEHLYLTDPILDFGHIDGIMFSGGVGEYVYGRETRDFGDMGRRLGRAIRRKLDAGALPWPLLPAGECIRATALGRLRIQRPALRQHELHLQSRRAAAAAQSAGAAADLRVRGRHRFGRAREGDPRASHGLRPGRRRRRGRARVALAGRAVL